MKFNLVPRVHRLHGQRFSRRVKLWGNGIFFPRIHGFRLLCACLASKTEVKKSGKTEGSVAQTRRIATSGDELFGQPDGAKFNIEYLIHIQQTQSHSR